jgi:hypothetical protein
MESSVRSGGGKRGLQDAEGLADPLADPAAGVHGQEDPTEGRGQPDGEVPVLVASTCSWKLPRPWTSCSKSSKGPFAHTLEAGEPGGAAVAAELEALEGDDHGLYIALAAHESPVPAPGL